MQNLPMFTDFASVSGKRVIVRVDFNVPAEDNIISDDYRLVKTIPLLKKLRDHGARLVLLSHLTEKKEHRSFAPLLDELQRIMGFPIKLSFSPANARMNTSPVVLLENLRTFQGEEANAEAFAKELATLGDVYINEAFSQSHRPYASIVGLPRLLPTYMGLLFSEEVRKLKEVLSPEHPFLLVLGGIKFETKIGVLEHFVNTADKVFVGGALANTFLAAQGIEVGTSPVEQKAIPQIRNVFVGRTNLLLPEDVRILGNEVRSITAVGKEDFIYDVGPASLVNLSHVIHEMRMILWNGPLGFVEKGYIQGTLDLIDMLANCSAKVVIGGGDTIGFIRRRKIEAEFYHLSTGGGAMLEFMAKGTLPGIDAILENKRVV